LALFVALPLSATRRRAVTPPSQPATGPEGITALLITPPQPFTGHGAQHLAWEIFLANGRDTDITLQSFDVVSESGVMLASYDASAMRALILNVPLRNAANPNPPRERIRAKELALVFLWMTQPDLASVPPVLSAPLAEQ